MKTFMQIFLISWDSFLAELGYIQKPHRGTN